MLNYLLTKKYGIEPVEMNIDTQVPTQPLLKWST
jgi:hypothetical protein